MLRHAWCCLKENRTARSFSKVTLGATYRPLWPVRPPNPPLLLFGSQPGHKCASFLSLPARSRIAFRYAGTGSLRFIPTTIFETPRLRGRYLVAHACQGAWRLAERCSGSRTLFPRRSYVVFAAQPLKGPPAQKKSPLKQAGFSRGL